VGHQGQLALGAPDVRCSGSMKTLSNVCEWCCYVQGKGKRKTLYGSGGEREKWCEVRGWVRMGDKVRLWVLGGAVRSYVRAEPCGINPASKHKQ
jgi:hypothetical protein